MSANPDYSAHLSAEDHNWTKCNSSNSSDFFLFVVLVWMPMYCLFYFDCECHFRVRSTSPWIWDPGRPVPSAGDLTSMRNLSEPRRCRGRTACIPFANLLSRLKVVCLVQINWLKRESMLSSVKGCHLKWSMWVGGVLIANIFRVIIWWDILHP